MSGNIPEREKKILYLKSGNRCAMPSCHRLLVVDGSANDKDSIVAEMAHIKGENISSARYDPTQSETERNKYENLILICPTCHKIIDDQEVIYTIEYLYKIKQDHEKWINTSTEAEILNVTFAELAEVMQYFANNELIVNQLYTVIPPKDKIAKNKLSPQVESLIVMGLTQAPQIRDYLNTHHDIEFASRLVAGFIKEYNRLKYVEQLESDELFFNLLNFAANHRSEFIYRATGLAVLSYFFEKCEVFEK